MSKTVKHKEDYKKQFDNILGSLSQKWGRREVLGDFVIASACELALPDAENRCNRKKMQEEVTNKYSKDEKMGLNRLFELLVQIIEENPKQDFLGEYSSTHNMLSTTNGEVFTPYEVAVLMAELTGFSFPEEKAFVTVGDCAYGAGVLLIAHANTAMEKGINYQNKIFYTAQDLNLVNALMCFVQLSLLGCAARVIVGNSLSPDLNLDGPNVWFTPNCFTPTWLLRLPSARRRFFYGQSSALKSNMPE